MNFYICNNCKNIITSSNAINTCCDSKLTELIPNSTDAAQEKHVPVVNVNGNIVEVKLGEISHPMTDEHLFNFVCLETEKGYQVKTLTSSDDCKCEFTYIDDKPKAVYAYCNLHGLWKKDV